MMNTLDAPSARPPEGFALPDASALPKPPGPVPRPPAAVLQWHRALARAWSDPGRELLKSHLFRLVSWPNLTRLPPEVAMPAARICALLWQKRTAGFLIPKVLGLPPEETLVLLHALEALGHVEMLDPPGNARPDSAAAAALVPAAQAAPRPLPADSLLGRLWRRLGATH